MKAASSLRALSLAFVAALTASSLFAQSDLGSISGFVKDPSGSTIPGATVTVRNQNGLERATTTTDSGNYSVTNIPSGLYTVTVTAAGFKTFSSSNNKLDPSGSLELDPVLPVGASSESVDVMASALQLQTENAAVQGNITRQQIDSLEVNGRNPILMANLVPGTRGGNLGGLNFNFNQGPSNFNGSRNPENIITYDGAPATRTRSNGTSLGAADVDSTQEIQVLTADYAAEYGRSSGGQIRILTRSGGTDFHGALFEYDRNNVFNANTWTRNHTPDVAGVVPFSKVAPFRYNQYGYNVGGPFYIPGKFNKDKTRFFWYWGQEWVKYRFTDSAAWTVPSAAMRNGDFSELLNPNNSFITRKDANGNKIPVLIKDPVTGIPFPNNVIPTAQLSPNGVGILRAYPVANLLNPINGSNNYYITALHPQDQRKDTLSVDMNITEKQRLQFRRMNYSFFEYQPLDGTPTETPKYFNRPNQTNSLDYVWTVNSHLVNETLATVSLDDVYIPVDTAHFFDRTTAGINYPYIFPTGKLIQNRIPTASISSLNTLTGNPYPSHSAGPIYTVTDSLTWIKGNHTFKFGMYFERSGENDNDEINVNACSTCTNNQNGQFSFTDSRSGHPSTSVAMANAALGLFDSYSELGPRAYTIFRGSSFEPYAQDSWKVTQKLTLNLGLRYTVIVPYKALWANMAVFDPTLYDPSKAVAVSPVNGAITVGNGDRYNGLVIPGTSWPSSAKGRFPEATSGAYDYLFRGGKYPDYYSNIQWNDIQPRVGIAYHLNEKTVIRAGGGRFFTRLGVSDSIFLGGNPPFQPTANVSFGSADNPGGTSTNVLPLTATTQSRNFKNPEAWNWNFTVEREIWWKSILSVGYVGRRGLHLQRESDINQPTTATILANPGVNIDSLRPYKGYNSIRETDNVASSRYNSLQVAFNRRFASDLMIGLAYTFSHSMDDGSAQRDVIPDTYYAGNLWGNSQFDVQHVLVINYTYDLPFLRHQNNLTSKILGGWQVSGITQFQTGGTCTAMHNNDYAGVGQDGNLDGNCTTSSGQLWAINGDPKIIGQMAHNGSSDPNQWFAVKNPDGSNIFVQPAAGTFVTQTGIRDRIHNPGLENWNIGLYKKFAINERFNFQFRAEAFNALNHPNWNAPNFDPTSSSFGKVTGKTDDVRNLQLSLRLNF